MSQSLARWRDIALATAAFATVLGFVFLPAIEGAATRGGGSTVVVATGTDHAEATRLALNAVSPTNESR